MRIECYPIAKERFYSCKSGIIGSLEVARYIATTLIVQEIEAKTTSDDIYCEFENNAGHESISNYFMK